MKKNLRKMLSYYKPYLGIFMADMFFALGAAAVSLIVPLVVRFITSEVIYRESGQAFQTIMRLGIILLILIAGQMYCNYFIGNYGHVMGAKIEYDMRAEIFGHYQKLSFTFYDEQKVGQLMSRITSDLFDITELLHHGPENIVISIIKIIGAFVIMMGISPRLTLAAFALVPFMLVYAYIFNRKMKKAFRMNRIRIADINSQIEDNLSGIRVVKSFANEDVENEKFKKGNNGFLEAKKNSYRYMGGYQGGLTAFTMAITVVVIMAGGVMITRGTGSITDLVTFLLYINVFTEPIKTLIDFTEQFQNGYSGFERFMEMMSVEPDIQDQPDALPLKDVKGDIAFEDVSFHYADSDQMVLNHVDLSVKAGEYIALVGSSGAGKSTLCSLIPRFYDVSEGRILVDGRDIRKLKLKDLRSQIGIVQQDVYLFAGTILENISYGKPDATREEVIEAAKEANAHEFIMSFPDGYDTDIGQRGVKLSGGQKQRLSIARVFLKNPPILIFDEATSALDNESEKVVQDSLEKLAKNRTTFVIAHRLSTIRNAERILVLTDNGIEESGTHRQLLERGGIYKKLYEMQWA
ncbi:MAG TPA: ABC transporter ATP-binding protein/permease [Candidatus Eisenbergiella pullistercoris]|uniref:ABC transporter ATP-binding protein/permease n=1 Tax=Candidatus Eisenbergiella pullistercoris TaxID=2838555 RepID=A0A9D2C582_9FIRM|nr:ABC transporter ATP-binding protein/permease [Candidatus Eisenbergiella pullistercoris]